MPASHQPRFIWFVRFLAVLAAYAAGGWIGLTMPYVDSHISLIWPPTGIALAALLCWGLSLWPAVLAGAFLVNLAVGSSPELAFGIACGNALGPWLAARLLRQRKFDPSLPRRRDLVLYLAIGALGGMAINATNGILQLWLAGVVPAPMLASAWLTWWLGDAMGALVMGIPLLTANRQRWHLFGRRGAELGVLLVLTLAVGGWLFLGQGAAMPANPLLYLPFFLLSWLAIRGGANIASTAALLLSGQAVWATANGTGPFHFPDLHVSLTMLWGYMATATVITVLITVLLEELRGSERRLTLATLGGQLGLWDWHLPADQVVYTGDLQAALGIDSDRIGTTRDEWVALILPEDRPILEKALANYLAAGASGLFETEYRLRGEPDPTWIQIRGQVVERDEQGQPVRMSGTVQNITDRKCIEGLERRQRENLVRLNEVAALSHLPLAELLQRSLTIVAEHLGLEFGIVSQVDGGTYTILAHVAPPGSIENGQAFPLGDTYCDITLRQEGVVAIPEMKASPYLGHPCYRAFALEAYIGAPVMVAGEVFGTVNFSSPRPYYRSFDLGDLEFVHLLAQWVGSAIERDQGRKRLAASQAHLQAIIDNEPECVKLLAPNGKLLEMNRAGLAMIEADSLEEANACDLFQLIGEEHRAAYLALIERVFRGESGTLEYRIVGRRGTVRWLDTHAAPLRGADGSVTALLAVTRDISAKKQAESQLRLAASVFTHAHEGIVICDANQIIVDVNPNFTKITGFARQEVLGRTPRCLRSGVQDADFYRAMWQAIEADGYWEGEIWNKRKDASIYAERLTISSVFDEQGRVTHYIGSFSDITAEKEHKAQLEYLAHYDALTKLPNRVLLSDRMGQALAHAGRTGKLLALCYLDLDGFKAVNDQYGHDAGDSLLIEVANRLAGNMRAGDTVARLGGDEFVLLLVDLHDAQECDLVMTRILAAISEPVRVVGDECLVSGSIGIALFPADGSDADTLLRQADQAMYAAKLAGKNQYRLFGAAPVPPVSVDLV